MTIDSGHDMPECVGSGCLLGSVCELIAIHRAANMHARKEEERKPTRTHVGLHNKDPEIPTQKLEIVVLDESDHKERTSSLAELDDIVIDESLPFNIVSWTKSVRFLEPESGQQGRQVERWIELSDFGPCGPEDEPK
ncbi:MAG: hypothetical protein MMC23_000456 [Stictis urceolatum]|nr:hypothetical protein [Stictis urceolata]